MKLLDCKLLDKNITRRQNHLIDSGHVGCCEIVVRQNGTKILHKSFGCEQNLMYRLASMTKPVTAVAVLSEVQKGRLSWMTRSLNSFRDLQTSMWECWMTREM